MVVDEPHVDDSWMDSPYEQILVDELSLESKNPLDRGWRLRVFREGGDNQTHLFSEQVKFLERVRSPHAHHMVVQTSIKMDDDEVRWVVRSLREATGDVADVEALKAEIERLRAVTVDYEELERLREEREAILGLVDRAEEIRRPSATLTSYRSRMIHATDVEDVLAGRSR